MGRMSLAGALVGGAIAAVGILLVTIGNLSGWGARGWPPAGAWFWIFFWSLPGAFVGFLVGALAGAVAKPAISAALGAGLSACLPLLCCGPFLLGPRSEQVADAILPIILEIVAVGTIAGGIGGAVGRRVDRSRPTENNQNEA